MILLLDVGNSRIKWGCVELPRLALRGTGSDVYDVDTLPAILSAALPADWTGQVWLSCVAAPEVATTIGEWCDSRSLTLNIATTAMNAGGLKHGYAEPSQLGIDRWLAMLAARERCNTSVGVVDAGSAITIDLVDAQGQHLGGLILPGAALMHASLRSGTALHWSEATPLKALATNTSDAIHNGVAAAVQGAVNSGMAWAEALGRPEKWLLTGGDADLINGLLDTPIAIHEHLVLEGLAFLASKQEKP